MRENSFIYAEKETFQNFPLDHRTNEPNLRTENLCKDENTFCKIVNQLQCFTDGTGVNEEGCSRDEVGVYARKIIDVEETDPVRAQPIKTDPMRDRTKKNSYKSPTSSSQFQPQDIYQQSKPTTLSDSLSMISHDMQHLHRKRKPSSNGLETYGKNKLLKLTDVSTVSCDVVSRSLWNDVCTTTECTDVVHFLCKPVESDFTSRPPPTSCLSETVGTKQDDTATGADIVAKTDSARGTNTVNKTDTARGTNTVNKADTVRGTNTVNKTDTARGTNTVNKTDTARGTNTVNKTDTARGTKTVNKTDTARGTYTVNKANTARGTITVNKADTARGTNTVKADTARGTYTVNKTDTARGTNTVNKADTARGTNTVKKTDTARGTNTVKKTNTARGTNTVNKADTARGTNTVNKADTARGTNTVNKTDTARGTNTVNKANTARGTNTVNKADTARGTNTVNKADTARGTYTVNKANTARGTITVNKADTARGTNTVNKTDTARGTNTVNKTDTARGTNTVNKTDTARGTNTVNKADTARGTNTVKKTDTARGTNTVNKADTARGTNTVKKTDTARGTNTVNKTDTARGTNTVNKANTARGTNTVNKADTARGTNTVNKTDNARQTNIVGKTDNKKGITSVAKTDSVGTKHSVTKFDSVRGRNIWCNTDTARGTNSVPNTEGERITVSKSHYTSQTITMGRTDSSGGTESVMQTDEPTRGKNIVATNDSVCRTDSVDKSDSIRRRNAVAKTDTVRGTYAVDKKNIVRGTNAVVKTDTVRRTNAVAKTDTVRGTNAVAKSDTVRGTNAVAKTDTVRGTNAVAKSDTVRGTNTVAKTDTVRGTNAVAKTDTVRETNTVAKTDTVRGTNTVAKTDTVRGTNAVAKSDTVRGTNTVAKIDTVRGTNDVAKSDTVRGTNTVVKTDTVRGTHAVAKTDTVRGTNAVAKTDTVRGTNAVAKTDTLRGTNAVAKTDTVRGTNAVAKSDTVRGTYAVAKSDTVRGTNAVAKTDTVRRTNAVAKTDTVRGTNAGAKSDTVSGTNCVAKTDTVRGTNAVAKSDTVRGTNSVAKTDTVRGTNAVAKSDTVRGTNSVAKTDTLRGTNAVAKSDTVRGTNAVAKTDTVRGTNAVAKSDTVRGTNSVVKTDTVRGTNAVAKSDTVRGTNAVVKTDTVRGTHAVAKTDTVRGTHAVAKTDTVRGTNTVAKTDTVRGTNAVAKTDTVRGTNTVVKTDTVRGTNAVAKTDTVRGTNTVVKTDTVRGTNAVAKTDTVRGTNTVVKTDTVRGTNTVVKTDTVRGINTVSKAVFTRATNIISKSNTTAGGINAMERTDRVRSVFVANKGTKFTCAGNIPGDLEDLKSSKMLQRFAMTVSSDLNKKSTPLSESSSDNCFHRSDLSQPVTVRNLLNMLLTKTFSSITVPTSVDSQSNVVSATSKNQERAATAAALQQELFKQTPSTPVAPSVTEDKSDTSQASIAQCPGQPQDLKMYQPVKQISATAQKLETKIKTEPLGSLLTTTGNSVFSEKNTAGITPSHLTSIAVNAEQTVKDEKVYGPDSHSLAQGSHTSGSVYGPKSHSWAQGSRTSGSVYGPDSHSWAQGSRTSGSVYGPNSHSWAQGSRTSGSVYGPDSHSWAQGSRTSGSVYGPDSHSWAQGSRTSGSVSSPGWAVPAMCTTQQSGLFQGLTSSDGWVNPQVSTLQSGMAQASDTSGSVYKPDPHSWPIPSTSTPHQAGLGQGSNTSGSVYKQDPYSWPIPSTSTPHQAGLGQGSNTSGSVYKPVPHSWPIPSTSAPHQAGLGQGSNTSGSVYKPVPHSWPIPSTSTPHQAGLSQGSNTSGSVYKPDPHSWPIPSTSAPHQAGLGQRSNTSGSVYKPVPHSWPIPSTSAPHQAGLGQRSNTSDSVYKPVPHGWAFTPTSSLHQAGLGQESSTSGVWMSGENTWLPVYGETRAPAESHTHTTLYQTNVHPFGQAQTGSFADKRAQAAVSHHFQTREQTVNETGDHLQTIPANQHSRSNESHLQSDLHQMISSADTGEENYGKKLPRPKSRWDQISRVSDGKGSSLISKLKTSSTLPVTELPQECLNIPLCDVGRVSGQILDTQTFKVLTESSNPLQSKAHVSSSQQCMSNLYPQSPSATNSSGNSSSITNMDTLPGTGFYFKAFSTMPALSTVTRPSSVSHIPASSTEERPCFSNLTTPPVSILSFEALPTVQLFFPACPTVSSPHSSVQSNDPPLTTTSRCRHRKTAMLLPDSVPLTSSHLSHPGHSSENVTKPQTQQLDLNMMQMQLNNPMSVTGSHSLNINPSTLDNKSPNQSNTPMSVIEPHALNMMLRTSENPGQSYPDNTRAAEQLLSGNVNIKTHQTGSLSVIMDQNNTSEKGKVSFEIRHHKCLDQNSLNVGGAFSSHQGVVSDICKDQNCLEEGTVPDINKRPLMDKRFEDSSYRKTENVLEAISLSEPLETKSYTKEADDERDELTRGASHEVQDAADEGISSRVNDWQLCTSHNVQDSSVLESKMSLLDGSLPSLLQVEGTGEFPGTLDAGQTDRHCPCEGEGDNEALPIKNTNGTTEKKVNSDSREPGYSSNHEESCARVRHHLRDKGRINRITVMKPDFNNTEMIDVVSVTPDEVCQIREDVANIRCIDVESSTSDTAVKSTQQMLQTVTDEPHKRKRMSTDDCKRLNKKRKSQKHDLYQPPCYNGKLTSELTRRCSGSPIGRRSAGSEIPSGETRSKQPCSVPVECVQRRRSTRLFIKSSLSPQFDGSSLRQRCTSIPSGIGCGRSDSNCTGHCTDPGSMEGHRRRSTRLVIKESIVQECVRASEIQLQRKEINQNSVKDLLSDKETTSSQNLMFYVCGSTCGFSSLYGDELKKHVLECTLPGSLDCYHCGFKARDNDALVAHILNHSDRYENLHKCSVPDCKFETNVLHSYQTHLQETHPQLTRYVCHDCDSVYNDMDDLVKHVHDNLRLIVWCKYCDAIACDERLILDHIQKVHQKSLGTWTMNDLLCGERKAFAKSSSQLKWNPYVRMRRLHRSISDGVETSDVSVEDQDVDMVSFLTEVENDTLQGSFVNSSTENIIP